MRRALALTVGILLLLGAGALVVWRGEDEPDNPNGNAAPRASGARAAGGDSKGGPRHGMRGEAHAGERLRAWLGAAASAAPEFAQVEKLMGQLDDDEIATLILEAREHRPDSVGGWIRCALFAERARRDPPRALVLLEDSSLWSWNHWALRQAWFSTFRGWAEVDPRAAAAELAKYAGLQNHTGRIVGPEEEFVSAEGYASWLMRDDYWKQQSFLEVFRAFAKSDPDAAWEALPELEMAGLRDSALEGMFRGVEGEENLRRLLALWEAEWNIADRLSHYDAVELLKSEPRLNDESARASKSTIGLQAAFALAEYDFAEAAQWLRTTGSGEKSTRFNRERLLYESLAAHDPAWAVEILRAGSEQGAFILTSLVRSQPQRAAEYLALVDDRDVRSGSVMLATNGQSRLDLEDLFPAPERRNRLPDYEGRYHGLLEAIAEGNFDPAAQRTMRTQLHHEFAEVLPEAAEALKESATKAP